MNSRAAVYALTMLALVGTGSVLVWALIRFATPRAEYVEIGRLSDFPLTTHTTAITRSRNRAYSAIRSASGETG